MAPPFMLSVCDLSGVGIRWTMDASGVELTDEEKEIINGVLARAAMMETTERERIG